MRVLSTRYPAPEYVLAFSLSVSALFAGGSASAAVSSPGVIGAVPHVTVTEEVRWVCGPWRCAWRPNWRYWYVPPYARAWGPPPGPACRWVRGPSTGWQWSQVCP